VPKAGCGRLWRSLKYEEVHLKAYANGLEVRSRPGSARADAPLLKALLASYPSEGMVAWPVSPRVGNVKNNDPSLIEPFSAG
jgi:hypothetical protein